MHSFLTFHDRKILPDAGKVSKKEADEHAKIEYDKFAVQRRESKEISGQEDSIKLLEATAKLLSESKEEK